MTTHVSRTPNSPPMNSMSTRRYISTYVANPKGGYREPSVVIAQIHDHKDGHYVRPNRVAPKYPNFKKDVDLDVHVKVFNYVMKANVETSKNISLHLTIC
jgi:hypothetical protein